MFAACTSINDETTKDFDAFQAYNEIRSTIGSDFAIILKYLGAGLLRLRLVL